MGYFLGFSVEGSELSKLSELSMYSILKKLQIWHTKTFEIWPDLLNRHWESSPGTKSVRIDGLHQ